MYDVIFSESHRKITLLFYINKEPNVNRDSLMYKTY